jgi:RES domain
MRFWRICRERYAAEAASGEGARLFGGRWNNRGVRVVYASMSSALAAMETFVNLEPNLQPDDLASIEGEMSTNFKSLGWMCMFFLLIGTKREMNPFAPSAMNGSAWGRRWVCWFRPRQFSENGISY